MYVPIDQPLFDAAQRPLERRLDLIDAGHLVGSARLLRSHIGGHEHRVVRRRGVRLIALAAGWGAAEALIWPLMPEAALVPLSTTAPKAWWCFALASTLGSTIGGCASYAIGRRLVGAGWPDRLPLVRRPMVAAADAWLGREGPRGVLHQPLSGVPFKVFALLAGIRRLPPGPFLAWSASGRGARFALVCAAAALTGSVARPAIRRHGGVLLAGWAVVFGIGLLRTVQRWERERTG
jgi:membrane protein YqaA with SNARE-associated domain